MARHSLEEMQGMGESVKLSQAAAHLAAAIGAAATAKAAAMLHQLTGAAEFGAAVHIVQQLLTRILSTGSRPRPV